MVNDFLLTDLRRRDMEFTTFWFRQDGAKTYSARQSANTLKTVFEHRVISRNGDVFGF
jgi:hypothetical protein